MKRFLCAFLFIFTVILAPTNEAYAAKMCDTKFVNPFTDTSWDCLFPIRMAGMTLSPSGPDPETKVSTILCSCKDGLMSRIGITIGFREPSRLLDVVKGAFCMASLGFSLGNPNTLWKGGDAHSVPDIQTAVDTSYSGRTHYYYFNPLVILEILLDMACLEKLPLDVAAMSELDPLSDNEDLNILAFPETILFANPVAVLACAADAIASVGGNSLDSLFWCAGAWGVTYPLTNMALGDEGNFIASSALVASKHLARGHRELMNWGTKGKAAMCGPYPQPIWQKTQYKFQMVQPIKVSKCIPIGRSSLLWDYGKNPPVPGKTDNFVYMVWRYRDCCMF